MGGDPVDRVPGTFELRQWWYEHDGHGNNTTGNIVSTPLDGAERSDADRVMAIKLGAPDGYGVYETRHDGTQLHLCDVGDVPTGWRILRTLDQHQKLIDALDALALYPLVVEPKERQGEVYALQSAARAALAEARG